jgi:hypothetical protein
MLVELMLVEGNFSGHSRSNEAFTLAKDSFHVSVISFAGHRGTAQIVNGVSVIASRESPFQEASGRRRQRPSSLKLQSFWATF